MFVPVHSRVLEKNEWTHDLMIYILYIYAADLSHNTDTKTPSLLVVCLLSVHHIYCWIHVLAAFYTRYTHRSAVYKKQYME